MALKHISFGSLKKLGKYHLGYIDICKKRIQIQSKKNENTFNFEMFLCVCVFVENKNEIL